MACVPIEQSESSETDFYVSVVMPCLDEEESVAECVQKARAWLARSGLRGEVIVVDNGSTDRSAELAEKAGARVIHEAQRGKGRACQTGFEVARGRIIVLGDADASYDFGDIGLLTEPLYAGYDLVIGNRLNGLRQGAMSWSHRQIGNPLISLCVRLSSGARVSDSLSGFRAFTREAYQRMGLKSGAFEIECEMILRAAARGLRIKEVTIPYYARKGESKLRTFSDGWRIIRFLLLQTPQYLFLVPGLLFVLLGLFALAVAVFTSNGITVGSVTWQPIFAGGIFLVIGTNITILGVGSKLFAMHQADQEEDWIVRFYRRHLGLERLLAVAAGLAIIGAGIDGFIFVEWLADSSRDLLALAAVAQSLIVIGVNLAFGALLVAMIDYDYQS
jgi:glycosyltransferase involved in cell wall biosynthesis